MSPLDIKSGIPSFYSPAHVAAYAHVIGLDTAAFVPDLASLARVVKLHLLAFPFENSRLHYSAEHEVDTSPEAVYDRLVANRLGGVWCCGANGLLLGMLRGLGYRAIGVFGRVNMSPPSSPPTLFTFLSHMAVLVQLPDNTPYLVDVGFGGNGIVRPIPLQDGAIVPGGASPEEHRLTRFAHPQSSLNPSDASLDWALQYRCPGPQAEWATLYIFKLTEMIEGDWVAYAQWLSAHPPPICGENVLCVRYFLADPLNNPDAPDAPIGRMTMVGNKTHRRVGDTSVPQKEFSTEEERVRILKEDFGIHVGEEEIGNIRGPVALPRAA
ncbi:hypothetical protein M422DRAFT_43051 [Sphaerobolus stellatus SS14]|nr:hypothetical protein M422DRAFT_43051 [Sphaerobolus stellatus SS14]